MMLSFYFEQRTNYRINLKQISKVIFCDNLTLISLIQYDGYIIEQINKKSLLFESSLGVEQHVWKDVLEHVLNMLRSVMLR